MRLQLSRDAAGCASDAISEVERSPRQTAISGEAEVRAEQGNGKEPSGCDSRIRDVGAEGITSWKVMESHGKS